MSNFSAHMDSGVHLFCSMSVVCPHSFHHAATCLLGRGSRQRVIGGMFPWGKSGWVFEWISEWVQPWGVCSLTILGRPFWGRMAAGVLGGQKVYAPRLHLAMENWGVNTWTVGSIFSAQESAFGLCCLSADCCLIFVLACFLYSSIRQGVIWMGGSALRSWHGLGESFSWESGSLEGIGLS